MALSKQIFTSDQKNTVTIFHVKLHLCCNSIKLTEITVTRQFES